LEQNTTRSMNVPSPTRWVWMIALTVILSLGTYLRYESLEHTEVIDPIRADARDYLLYAFNLKFHGIYSRSPEGFLHPGQSAIEPDAVRPPGYPLFLTLFVDNPPSMKALHQIVFAQSLLSCLTLIAGFCIFLRFLPLPWALSATMLLAMSPHLVVAPSYLLTETLFSLLLVLFAWSLGSLSQEINPLRWSLSGMVLGIACLVRPYVQYLPIVLSMILIASLGWRQGLKGMVGFMLGFALILSPWVGRNLLLFGKASDPTLTIDFIHHGVYPNFTFEGNPGSYGFPYRFDPRSGEINQSVGTALQEMVRRFQEEPIRHLGWYLVGKPIALWSWNVVQGMGDAFVYSVASTPYQTDAVFKRTHWVMRVLHPLIVILGLLGSLLAWRAPSSNESEVCYLWTARWISVILLYSTAIHMIGAPFPRYSIPLRPLLYGMAVFGSFLIFSWGVRVCRRSFSLCP
jgi:hypothetical protein